VAFVDETRRGSRLQCKRLIERRTGDRGTSTRFIVA
jgi:hypothetical protein